MATQQELDDLDDLDDILDDFDSTTAEAGPSTSTSTTQVPHGLAPPPVEVSEPDFDDDDFALQLQKGMEQLMREMETSPSARNEFEQLVKSMSDATAGPGQSSKTTFSDTLSRTMERMQESEIAADQARDEAASQNETDAFLAEMVKQLAEMSGQGDGNGVGGEEGMTKLLEGMMEQLMSKDILYEPMKDLQERYPPWLESNKGKLSEKEYETYSTQFSYVKQIMTKFDDPKYNDEDAKGKTELVDLMQKMQELGPPPKEIMSELAPGMELDSDGLPVAPGGEQCNVM